jgi:hypothetical protein
VKRTRAYLSLATLAVAGVVTLVTLVSARRGTHTVVDLTLAFTILAALAATIGSLITWLGNRASDRHQHELAQNQAQMAEDIRLLAELTESSLEEARAQRPLPVVHFLLGNEGETADGAVITRKRSERTIDVERIVARGREAALASIPAPKPEKRKDQMPQAFSILSQVSEMGTLGSLLGGKGPVTKEERAKFKEAVDSYERSLRDWLVEYENWRALKATVLTCRLQFENVGRVPARGARVQLHFPDSFEGLESYPELEVPPDRPKFKRYSPLDALSVPAPAVPRIDLERLAPGLSRSNVSGPRFKRGSLLVEFKIEKLLHGVPEETDTALILRASDGDYEVPWEIHAENLPEVARGTLRLRLETEVESGPPINSLDEIVARRTQPE